MPNNWTLPKIGAQTVLHFYASTPEGCRSGHYVFLVVRPSFRQYTPDLINAILEKP